MKKTIWFFLCLSMAVTLGCSNAIYFYETEKVSIGLEVKPDVAQPVAGNIGIKQRVVVVTPPKQTDASLTPKSDSVSMISRFDLNVKEEPNSINPITVETTLLTGAAAAGLDRPAAQEAFGALAGLPVGGMTPAMSTLSLLYSSIHDWKTPFDDTAKQSRFVEERNRITAFLNLSAKKILSKFDKTFIKYIWNPKTKNIDKEAAFGRPRGTTQPAFNVLTYYRDGLNRSCKSLEGLTANFSDKKFTFTETGGTTVSSDADKQEYLRFFNDQKEQLVKIDGLIRNDPAIRDALEFYNNLFFNG